MSNPQKRKGDAFERSAADYLAEVIPAERIPAGATIDRGDIWTPGAALECKNRTRLDLPGWWRATQNQMGARGVHYGFLIHKRAGTADAGRQWVTTDLEHLRRILDHLHLGD